MRRGRQAGGAPYPRGDLLTSNRPRTPRRSHRRTDGNQPSEQTDTGNACEFASDHGPDVHWTLAHDWLVWDGRRWRADDTLAVIERAKSTAGRLIDDAIAEFGQAVKLDQDDEGAAAASKAAKSRLKHALQTRNKKGLDPMLALARSIPGIATTFDQFDRHPHLFNVLNGTIHLRTGELRPRPGRLHHQLAPVEFDPDSEAPTWDKFLATVFAGDRELIESARAPAATA